MVGAASSRPGTTTSAIPSLAVVPPDGISALFLKEMGAVVPGGWRQPVRTGSRARWEAPSNTTALVTTVFESSTSKGWLTQVTLRNGWNYSIL